MDLFASRLTTKLTQYCSWQPDPGSAFVDAFSIDWSKFNFYAFPPFSLIPRCLQKIQQDKGKGILIVPVWPTQTWFPLVLQLLYSQPWICQPSPKLLQHTSHNRLHPLHQKLHLMVCPLSGTLSDNTTFLKKSSKSSWLHGGRAPRNNIQHTSWLEFCSKRTIDYSSPKISEAVEFLMTLHSQALRYFSINTARSALSSILKLDNWDNFGTHPLVTRLMKGIYELIKPKPKYNQIWDVSVLDYLKTLYPLEKLSLKELTQKTVMLLLLVTGQRGQFIHLLSLNGIQLTPQTAYLSLEEHTKTSRPNKAAAAVTITEFTPDSRICPLTTLKAYMKETETLRNGENKLFISFIKPNKAVSRDTISRWKKQVLTNSGIDTKTFTSHSTRAASAIKAHQNDIPLDTILNTTG